MATQKLSDDYFREKAHIFFQQSAGKDQQGLYLLLKEVSRDTRHTCAEAALALHSRHIEDFVYSDGYNDCRNDAYAACVNAVGK